MGKASDVFRTPRNAFPMGRLVFLIGLVALVLIGITMARGGFFSPRPAPVSSTAETPSASGALRRSTEDERSRKQRQRKTRRHDHRKPPGG